MAILDSVLGVVNMGFFYAMLVWLLVDTLRESKRSNHVLHSRQGRTRCYAVFATTASALSSAIISVLNIAFAFHEYSNTQRIIGYNTVSLALTWLLATIVSLYSMKRMLKENKKYWPLVLNLWWVFATVLDGVSVCMKLTKNTKSMKLWFEENIVDVVSFPLLLLLCFNIIAMPMWTWRFNNVEKEFLLHKEFPVQPSLENDDERTFTKASMWSHLMFMWLNPIFKRGRIQKLELLHIPHVPHSETAESASSLLEESLLKQKVEDVSLTKAIAHFIWKTLAFNAVFAGVNTIASYMGPLLITNFVNFLLDNDDNSSNRYGLILAFIFFLLKTVESLTQRQWYFGAQRIGIRVRAALMVLLYKKSLSIQHAGTSRGKIINLINVDAERIGDFCWYIHGVWLLPIQVILALFILYVNLGFTPSIAALAVTVLVILCNTPLAKLQESLHSKIMEAKDTRIKVTSETMKNIRILKMHSWESTFLKKVLHLRKTERKSLRKYLYTCSAVATLFWTSPTLVSAVTFGACILVKTELTAAKVLSALATFRILQEPIYNLPELISMMAQTKVSVDRILKFINEEDKTPLANSHAFEASDIAIEVKASAYAWEADQNNEKPTIHITETLKIKKGQKVGICGSVGSGKSSLLCCMLGEIPRVSGEGINIKGSRSFVPQSPWIQSGTIRENILFGKEMNKDLYEKVLEGCALHQDISSWVDGDLTMVGERGINLSGGQKQRIQLARAAYNNSDIYFLDDPFSAVDAHTGTHLFEKCLMLLLDERTVVYATHQLEFLEAADIIVVMKDGEIVEYGKYNDLMECPNSELVKQMAAHKETVKQINPCKDDDTVSCRSRQTNQVEVADKNLQDTTKDCKLLEKTDEEEAQTGRVKWSVYSTFVTSAYRGALVPVVLLCQIFFQGMQMGSSYWIAWATEQQGRVSNGQLMGTFVLLSGGSSIFILGRAIVMAIIAMETAQQLFHGMITSVFRAPISFFDTTPSSRILSRSSTDQSTVDTDIPYRLAGLVFALIQLVSIIILMSQVAWQVTLLFLVVLALCIWYQAYYITSARELARMVGVRKAPILHHFSESVAGATTIRCFNQEQRFLTKVMTLIDDYSRVAFHNYATMEWLSIRVNFLFNLVFYFVLTILVTLPRSSIDPSLAGLVATYGLNLNILQAWLIWNLCNVENKMISVERILQFTSIPSEAPLIIQDCRPEPEWPREGKVELHSLHIQYDPSAPMVLKGVSCTFPGQKKIGVVGRTGSGKSTLVQALFRVVDPSEGWILIDGVNIRKIGLQDLRCKLGIVPQDPTLFQGTVRTNLDPLDQHSDQELWEVSTRTLSEKRNVICTHNVWDIVSTHSHGPHLIWIPHLIKGWMRVSQYGVPHIVLDKCHLAEIVSKDVRLLDAPVAENGENWSVGQRQLVCLARLLLKKRRVLVLDEATASIDTTTDNLIQRTIRKETSGCTVITVAHRIPTVIDNDLVLVLDEGKIVEFDHPAQLLQNSSSSFSKLVSEFLTRSSQSNYQK